MNALDLANQDTNTDDPDPDYDMWKVGYRADVTAPTLGDMFRAIVNDPGHGVDITSLNQLTSITGFTTEDDFVSIIDWNDLDEKTKHAKQELRIGDYKLYISESINLYDMLKNEMVLHGVTPTYEWDQEAGQFRIRFRHMAPLNVSQASFSGRVIDNSTLLHGQTPESVHNDTWIANSAVFQANHDNGKYFRTYNITYNSGFAMNRKPSRKITVSSVMSHIGANRIEAENYFSRFLYHFARPEPVIGLSLLSVAALG
jgi:hypothetical protein